MCDLRLAILLVFTFLIVPFTKAQQAFNYSFRHITQLDGLLHNEVLSITQDGKGFIWIASRNGLQRYDGSQFIYYPEMLSDAAKGRTPGAEIYADKKNNLLWITNNTSIEKMELGKNNFVVYNPEIFLKDSSFIFTTYLDINNQQWILGRNTVFRYDSVFKKNLPYNVSILPAEAHQTSGIATDIAGNSTWVGGNSQLFLFDKKTRKVYSENFNPDNHPLLQPLLYGTRGKLIRFIMIDSRQNIWITTWSDIFYKYNEATKKVSSYSLTAIKTNEDGSTASADGLLINCMLEDDNHTIWVGTEGAGLLRYNPEKDKFDYCIAKGKNIESIWYDYKIFSLFQDKEQNIWIGTDKGISIFNPYLQYFKYIRHQENTPLSVSKSEIISFIQTGNGDMFIGTWGGGIAVYDSSFNFKKNIFFKDIPGKNMVWSFQQVDDKTLWIGCQQGYLLIYNLLAGTIQTLHPPEIGGSTIRCMEQDNKGNIWIGLHNGKIVKWDRVRRIFSPFMGTADFFANVAGILIDHQQHCWVSTAVGFKEFDLEKRVFTNTWLPGKTCQGIEEYDDSTLLIGTVYGGAVFFNKTTKIFSPLSSLAGLPHNSVYAIKKDTTGCIWFTTDYGLYKINTANKKYIAYNLSSGIVNSSFIANKFYSLQNGQWLTFTNTEAISFLPQKIEEQYNRQYKTEITGFKIFTHPVFIDSLLYGNKTVLLSYKENFFTVEFAALNFSGMQQTNYYYRLIGLDKDWVSGGSKRFASYTGLQPGEYFFEVKAENGNSRGEITSFKIIIAPPFWKTGWFISIISFCTLLLIYRFIKWRENSIKAVAREKLTIQQLNAGQYKSKLEMEQIINYFSSSLIDKNTVEDVLWDVAKNLIGRLGFIDCMMYLWNQDNTKMIQQAGFGPKGSVEEITKQPFDVLPGQGVVGSVMQTKEAVVIPDTSNDKRYRPDEMVRLSEICVPVMYNNELIGVIDSEHDEKNFFTSQHLHILSTIATLMANKIKSIEAEQLVLQKNIEMYSINEQLSKAKFEALRSQMNPHFIFNCINSIDGLIHSNDKYNATVYLNKFAKLLRNILDGSKQDTVPLSKDIDTLKLYTELEEFRNENKFKTIITVDDELTGSDYKVPPLIVQPFVENAILHGLRNKDGEEGVLIIDIKKSNDTIQYIITDNGIGRAAAKKIRQNKESHYGLQISYDRVKLFNKEEIASVQADDLYNGEKAAGTRITVNLNIK
jgi:ligand-binding sensor domain-containing protein/putative methionine-R-sulfoxide reductase with GAF domain